MAKVTQHLKDWVRNMKILNAIIFLQFLQILPIIFAPEILNSNIEQAQIVYTTTINPTNQKANIINTTMCILQ
jgi:hypothetical protein